MLFLFTYRLLIFGSYSGRSWNKSDTKKFPQFVNWNNVKDLSYLTSNFKPHHFPPFFVVTITCARASKYSIQSPLITIEAVSGSLRKYPGNFNRYLWKMLTLRAVAQLKFWNICKSLCWPWEQANFIYRYCYPAVSLLVLYLCLWYDHPTSFPGSLIFPPPGANEERGSLRARPRVR